MTRAECSILHPRDQHSAPDRLRVGPRDPLMGSLILKDKTDYMKRSIFILGSFVPVLAAITNVQVSSTIHMPAILGYTAPSVTACIVEVSKNATFTPLVNDINSTLFRNSNSYVGGPNPRQIVVGKMTVSTALDGRNYSRALETARVYYYRILCGVDTATGTFQTQNIPLGMTYVPNQPVDGTTGQ